jgi:hypothetical protein
MAMDQATLATVMMMGWRSGCVGLQTTESFSIYPGAKEICNGIDDNCDGQVDEGCSG